RSLVPCPRASSTPPIRPTPKEVLAVKNCFPVLGLLIVACLTSTTAPAAEQALLELKRGDKIALIGNTLADRMQHFGNFETLLHSRFPHHELVVRNLGFSGDELTLRLRSANFGTPDEHLKRTQADVILAFFGYNESFAGQPGLDKFKQDLAEF